MFISFQPMICTGASCLVFICIAVFVPCILLCCYFSSVYLINAKECFYRCPRVRVQDSSRDHPKVTLFPYSCSIKGMEFSFPIDLFLGSFQWSPPVCAGYRQITSLKKILLKRLFPHEVEVAFPAQCILETRPLRDPGGSPVWSRSWGVWHWGLLLLMPWSV